MAHLAPSHLTDYENAERRRHPAIFGEAPSSVQLGLPSLDHIYLKELIKSSAQSEFVKLEQVYSSLRDQLAVLRSLRPGWDSYRAPAPNAASIELAQDGLQTLRDLNAKPSAVLPSADGGVGICFMEADRYAHVEFLNNGHVHGLMYGGGKNAESWELESADGGSLRRAWNRISAYLQS